MDNILFYLVSVSLLATAFRTVTHKNPIYGALYLAASMVLLAALFYLMGAPFLAGVQLAVYAGAVIVLFVMVLMLFDLKQTSFFSQFSPKGLLVFFLGGMILGVILLESFTQGSSVQKGVFSTNELAQILFTRYLLLFELLGLLLLLIAVGVVTLTRLDKEK